MLNLTYANQMEALIEPLIQFIDSSQKNRPMEVIHIVSPNPSVAHYVKFQIAEQIGVSANLSFEYLRRYLIELVEKADPQIQILQPESLQLLIYKRLTNSDVLQHIFLEPIRTYLDIAESIEERQMRTIQLAGQIARLFEEYGYSRKKMIKSWLESKTTLDQTQWSRAERWQRVLWQSIFHTDGTVKLDEIIATPKHQSMLFQQDEDLNSNQKKTKNTGIKRMFLPEAIELTFKQLELPEHLHIFGLSYIAPAFSDIIAKLSEKTNLSIYVINPCCEFWEDVDHRLNVAREGWISRSLRIKNLDEALDPFDLDNLQDAPALRLWGKPGREYIRTLNQLTECNYNSLFIDPFTGEFTLKSEDQLHHLPQNETQTQVSVLKQLQRDILFRAVSPPLLEESISDSSIRLIAAPGIRREVEIIADEIWHLMKKSEKANQPLRFHQIAVLVTDAQKQIYFTHIEAIFRERYQIPFNMIDRHASSQSRILEALTRLIDLPLGDLGVSSVMATLTHPLIGGALEKADLDLWERWVQQLNIRFGADQEALADTYIDRDIYHWDQGIKRIALGTFLQGEGSGNEQIFQVQGQTWLPYETSINHIGQVAQLIDLSRKLVLDCKQNKHAKRTLKDWAHFFLRLMNQYVKPKSVQDEQVLRKCIEVLDELADSDLEGSLLPYGVAQSIFKNKLKDLDGSKGQHLADGVVVASMLPMRALPFDTIFVMGLGEQDFPAKTIQDPLDLRQARQMIGDVTPAQRDRYLFLETLLSARQQIVLSYVALDDRTGDALEPSAVVRELHFMLKSYIGPQGLVAESHPLSPYDLFYDPEAQKSQQRTIDFEQHPLHKDVSEHLNTLKAFEQQYQLNAQDEGHDQNEGHGQDVHIPSDEVLRGISAVKLRQDLNQSIGTNHISRFNLQTALKQLKNDALNDFLGMHSMPVWDQQNEKKIKLTINRIRAFLFSPLQGSAQAVLKLKQEAIGQDERNLNAPLYFDSMIHQKILEKSFWMGHGKRHDVLDYYEYFYERSLLKGQAPVGIFAKEQKRRDHQILSNWVLNYHQFNLLPLELWQHIHIGEADEFEKLDLRLAPILLQVDYLNGAQLQIEITGRLPALQPDLKACMSLVHQKNFGEQHFLNGFLTMVMLAISNQPLFKEFRNYLNPHSDFQLSQIKQAYRTPSNLQARQWLTSIVAEMLKFHAYRFPIKSVLDWRDQLSKDSTAPFKLANQEYEKGPVPNVHQFDIPPRGYALQMIRDRFSPWFQSQIL